MAPALRPARTHHLARRVNGHRPSTSRPDKEKRSVMKYPPLLWQARRASVALVLICAAVTAAAVWRSSASKENGRATDKKQFHARIRGGVGREVRLSRGDAPGQARASVNSAAEFIRNRSGLSLSAAVKDRLTALEEGVRRGGGSPPRPGEAERRHKRNPAGTPGFPHGPGHRPRR